MRKNERVLLSKSVDIFNLFYNFGVTEVTDVQKWKEERVFLHFFRFFVTLEEFAELLCIKAMQRIEKIQGYDIETVLTFDKSLHEYYAKFFAVQSG